MKRVVSIEDLFGFKWLQAAALSSDGNTAVYAVSGINEKLMWKEGIGPDRKTDWISEKGEYRRCNKKMEGVAIYRLDLRNGSTRQLTSGEFRDVDLVLSPDGRTVAFTSDRSGRSQIYVIPLDGGEPLQITSLKQGASSPAWSRDGARIAFTAGIDDYEQESMKRAERPYRVTRNVWRYNGFGDLDLAVTHIYVVEMMTGKVIQLTRGNTMDCGPKWAPDSQRILFCRRFSPDRFEGIYGSLGIVDLNGNMETYMDGWGVESKEWLGDGRRIVFVGNRNAGSAAIHANLYVLDLNSLSIENRTPSLERSLQGWLDVRSPSLALHLHGDLWVTQDDKAVYARLQDGGRMQICRVAIAGAESTEVVVGGDRCCIPLDMVGDRLLFSVDDIRNPPDLHVAMNDGSKEKQLTWLNEGIMSQLKVGDYVSLRCKSVDGEVIEGWYVKPTGGIQAPFPSVLWIHGGPFGAQGYAFDLETLLLNGRGFGVMFFNYRGSSGYGNAFSKAPLGNWGGLDYDDLMAGVDCAIEANLANPKKLGVCGNSFGGVMSCFMVSKSQRFSAAVPQNALTDWQSLYGTSDIGVWFCVDELGGHPSEIPDIYRKCSPVTYAPNCRTPTLLVRCEEDWRCPPSQTEEFYTALRVNDCVAEMLLLPGASHLGSIMGPLPIRRGYLEGMLEWFTKYVARE